MVEFALILGVLLVFIFSIIEAGRLFQGWLTVQNSARAAGRYALTGNSEVDCLYEFPACLDPRVFYIKDESKRTAAGLSIDDDALVGEPGSFSTEVWSTDDEDNWVPDYAGRSGDPVRVKVTYDMPIVVPLFWVIAESVPLVGQVTVTNEQFDQVTTSRNYATPPDVGEGSDGLPQADLTISKSASPTTVYTEHPLDYTITVENNGPFDAEEIIVVDTLPAGSVYLDSTIDRGGYCDPPVGETLTCYLPNLAGNGGANSRASLVIYTTSPTDAPTNPTPITNVASVSNGPATIDPNMSTQSIMRLTKNCEDAVLNTKFSKTYSKAFIVAAEERRKGELQSKIDKTLSKINTKISWNWVKGHSDNHFNNKVDEIAVEEAMKFDKIEPTKDLGDGYYCKKCNKNVEGRLSYNAEADMIRVDCDQCENYIMFAEKNPKNLKEAKKRILATKKQIEAIKKIKEDQGEKISEKELKKLTKKQANQIINSAQTLWE